MSIEVLKVKVISLPYIFQVLYVLCFSRPRYQVSVYRTIGPLVLFLGAQKLIHNLSLILNRGVHLGICQHSEQLMRLT